MDPELGWKTVHAEVWRIIKEDLKRDKDARELPELAPASDLERQLQRFLDEVNGTTGHVLGTLLFALSPPTHMSYPFRALAHVFASCSVVGGAGHGGVLVRSGPALSDELCETRLATGAVVKEVETTDGRLCYELVRGDGPAMGWDLLVKAQNTLEEDMLNRSGESTPVMAGAEKEPTEDEREAFRQYTEKFGECRDGSNPGYSRKAFPWFTGKPPQGEKLSAESLQAALSYRPTKKRLAKVNLTEVDSDREEIPLCTRCSLPVGEFAYQGREGKDTCVHTECMAQVLMKEAQREEEHRTTRENNKKLKNRRVLDEASKTVRVAATSRCPVRQEWELEPSASVNLEYLLLALKVRKSASREPLFSLDPIDPKNLENSPQKKAAECLLSLV
ncbi:hypothetical protein AK812_SmicGene9850 [Symbiodinium microadriaticum]|uniref:Uncharacterized protein n=1 Tax=Symbiodinium microadriaticum TaxID=2951 RepID=A0A1Q9EHF1_SYMMI|nr:hypothetical protein AK812_SmicGene9850 [Symbiodinium microadriaticum]